MKMESIILQIAARHMRPLLIVVSLVVLYRGHNEPGGGFIGGLMFGSAFILYAMAYGVPRTEKSTFIDPINLTALGLLVALLSGVPALLKGKVYMTGEWITVFRDTFLELKLGTPLLFDLGVYFTVAGMLMMVMFSLLEE
jgi:multisubunit Na+/H+ antiporter MnhB subunit